MESSKPIFIMSFQWKNFGLSQLVMFLISFLADNTFPLFQSITKYSYQKLLCALFDSMSHGIISLIAWISIISSIPPSCILNDDLKQMKLLSKLHYLIHHHRAEVSEILVSSVLGCIIDIDHFISTGSLSYHAATHLSNRPFAHSVTFIVILSCLPLITTTSTRKIRYCILIFSALMTHILRDSTRRGLWFWPILSTFPLPRWLVVILQCTISLLGSMILVQRNSHKSNNNTNDLKNRIELIGGGCYAKMILRNVKNTISMDLLHIP
eukprot:gene16702-22845_t